MKGVDPILAGVLMILLSIVIAVMISGWLSTTTQQTGTTIKNQTKEQLNCNFANFYIRNVTYNCSDNCSAGVSHNLTIELVNSGSIAIDVDEINIQNTTGSVFIFNINRTTFSAGDIKYLTNVSTTACNGTNHTIEYVIVSSMACPATAYDKYPGNMVNFVDC